nr:hypothetical protein [Methylobacterium sp. L1A1]
MSEASTPDVELKRSSEQGELLALLRESMAASVEHQRLSNERMRRDLDRPQDFSVWQLTAIGIGCALSGVAVLAAGMLFGRYVL